MTDKELDENRLKITKEFLETGEILNLSGDFDLHINSSTPGIYHVFTNCAANKTDLIHQYSMTDKGLLNLVNNLKLETIKRIFVEGRYLRLQGKKVAENIFNDMDHECMS